MIVLVIGITMLAWGVVLTVLGLTLRKGAKDLPDENTITIPG